MDNYTRTMEKKAYEAANDYYPEKKLLEAAASFHKFTDALDSFIIAHGYVGSRENVSDKEIFLKEVFEKEGIHVPRRIREWYTKGKSISRTTAFQICFAFGLDKRETDDFFRRVMLTRSFDCHVMEEAVYYYCICNGKDYKEAVRLLEKAPLDRIPDITKSRMTFDEDILFTSSIMKEIEQFQSGDELLAYFRKNVDKFGYNHASATESLQKIWKEIRKKRDGLADLEKNKIQRFSIKTETERSISEILKQILGLDEVEEVEEETNLNKHQEPLYALKSDRSITPLLKDNPLLPEIARKQFPNRQTLEKILKGDHVDTESIRKTLILTYFYYFWIQKALFRQRKKGTKITEGDVRLIRLLNMAVYRVEPGDEERFISDINHRLLEAGYPDLYVGNPYDWVFVYCSMSEEPLTVFREFVHEMYLQRESDIMELNKGQKSRF